MKDSEFQKPSLNKLRSFKRRIISVSQEELIRTEYLQPEKQFPLVVKPNIDEMNLACWAQNNKQFIEAQLLKHGGILFRNFNLKGLIEFEEFIRAVSGELMAYSYRSTPRTPVRGKIYTSTEYTATRSIPLHNEMSYSDNWPLKIFFYCLQPAEKGGETPLANSQKVFEQITPKIRNHFQQKKVMYVRNYGDELDISWQNVFQTTNKSEVENYCRGANIEVEWKDKDRLRTYQICQSIATHPTTRQLLWFNQAHLFHISSLEPDVREILLTRFKEKDLPRNAYYGDGSPIENSVLEEIRNVYQQEAVMFTWKEGDILLLDNMLIAHGRMPFSGTRKVFVGMTEPFSSEGV